MLPQPLFVQFIYSSFSLRNKRTFAFSEVNLALYVFSAEFIQMPTLQCLEFILPTS